MQVRLARDWSPVWPAGVAAIVVVMLCCAGSVLLRSDSGGSFGWRRPSRSTARGGQSAWENWESEIRKVLPAGQYSIKDLALDHTIFHQVFTVSNVPQIPSINYWR